MAQNQKYLRLDKFLEQPETPTTQETCKSIDGIFMDFQSSAPARSGRRCNAVGGGAMLTAAASHPRPPSSKA